MRKAHNNKEVNNGSVVNTEVNYRMNEHVEDVYRSDKLCGIKSKTKSCDAPQPAPCRHYDSLPGTKSKKDLVDCNPQKCDEYKKIASSNSQESNRKAEECNKDAKLNQHKFKRKDYLPPQFKIGDSFLKGRIPYRHMKSRIPL